MRTSDWSNGYCPYLNVDVSIQSQNGDTATYAYTVTYCTTAGGAVYTNGNGRAWSFTADGRTINSGSININGKQRFKLQAEPFLSAKEKKAEILPWDVQYIWTLVGTMSMLEP